VVTREIKH